MWSNRLTSEVLFHYLERLAKAMVKYLSTQPSKRRLSISSGPKVCVAQSAVAQLWSVAGRLVGKDRLTDIRSRRDQHVVQDSVRQARLVVQVERRYIVPARAEKDGPLGFCAATITCPVAAFLMSPPFLYRYNMNASYGTDGPKTSKSSPPGWFPTSLSACVRDICRPEQHPTQVTCMANVKRSKLQQAQCPQRLKGRPHQ